MSSPRTSLRAGLLGLALLLASPILGEVRQPDKEQPRAAATLPETWTKALHWRSIGPANMSGRIVALAVNPNDASNYWVATASGGLLKTTNNGVTFEHQFDREATVSIGDVAVSASDPRILYVGTGENNPRNSVSYGDGVYKSVDGGKTWANVGLKKSFQIGKIVIHPKNPDIVYVGALGRLYGASQERGLFKTEDGGKSWKKILFVDDKTGVIEMAMSPGAPDTLLVATWERKRDGFDFNDPEVKWGAGSGLHKTTDGGKTWKKITAGLPTSKLGRIGLSYYAKDPKIVYAIVDCEKIGMGPKGAAGGGNAYMGITGENAPRGAKLTNVIRDGPADKAGLKIGDILTKIGDKDIKNYEDIIAYNGGKKPGDKVDVTFERAGKANKVTLAYGERPAGGRPGTRGDANHPFGANLGGQRENVTTQGPDAREYGGVYRSENGGDTWKRINSVNPRPMYFSCIRVDPSDEQYLYVAGVNMYRSADGGKSFRADVAGIHADQHALWIDPRDGRHMLVGCDGGFYSTYDRTKNWDHHNTMAIGQFYQVAIDPRPRYKVYGGLQDNGTWGGPTRTRTQAGPVNEDWVSIGGGDGFRCAVDQTDPDLIYWESQNGGLGRRNLRTGETASIRPKGQGFRWNWNTPFALAHSNQKIYYAAANVLFKSLDRGADLKAISPNLTRTNKGSASAFSESPKNPDVLWVGTDDGNLWVTRNGGKDWSNVTAKVGLPGPRWVASIEASRFAEGRAYVVFDGHRSDDDSAHVYVTEDYGATWKSLRANLPNWTTRVCREDLFNASVLYVGTEFALYASIDRGTSWTKINSNLPTVAVFDLAQHPTTGEIVLATHGRSLWVADVSALRQMTAEKVTAAAALYRPVTAIRWVNEPAHGRTNQRFAGENPPLGASLYYSLGADVEKMSLKIVDAQGKTVRDLQAGKTAGLHRVEMPLFGRGRGRPGMGNQGIAPGTYNVVLTVDGKDQTQPLKVEKDPTAAANAVPAELDDEDDEDEDQQID